MSWSCWADGASETNCLGKASKVESVWFHTGWKLERLQSTCCGTVCVCEDLGQTVRQQLTAQLTTAQPRGHRVTMMIFKTMLMPRRLDARHEAGVCFQRSC